MRRVAIVAAAGLIVALALVAGDSHRARPYRVAAVFDTAKGMVPGQLVKVAGAKVGTISKVQIVAGPRARVEMTINHSAGPFYADASCHILPQGPISEYFIDCNPGARRSGPTDVVDGLPTVARSHTTAPVTLQDVINTFSLPVDQRIGAFINELGIATAGRGGEINAILRRANPALTSARETLSIVNASARRLDDAVGQTDVVLAHLSAGRAGLRQFVDGASQTLQTTEANSASLKAGVRKLPATLAAVRRALGPLDTTMTATGPLLDELRDAGPRLVTANRVLPAFSRSAEPALQGLSRAADAASRAMAPLAATTRHLSVAARDGDPAAGLLDDFLTSLRDTGGIEGALRLVYAIATVGAARDDTSHMLSLVARVNPRCFVKGTLPGCSHNYSAPGHGTVPSNDPTAGPQYDDWDPTAPGSDPATTRVGTTSTPTKAQTNALLEYLLK